MRRQVPFVGEEHIERDTDEQAQAKKSRGRIIDEVLSTQSQPSSWDDHVAKDYDNPGLPQTNKPHASVAKPTRSGIVPMQPGATPPVLKKSPAELTKSSITTVIGTSAIDWVPINNGHGLRINIMGNLDQNIRSEWKRLLDETEGNGVGQFEFNLTQAPSLSLTGLGMLLLFKEQKGSERGDIKLCHCNKEVWQMLQWTGMDKYFTIQGIPGMEK